MPYPDSHPLGGAFLANRLDRLADLIAMQGEQLLRDDGLSLPSRAVSLMLLIGERTPLSAADAAAELGQPHQLVTQRADLLLDLGLINREGDPRDRRRKILKLNPLGEDQHARLQECLAKASDAFAALSEEIGCDLSSMAVKAMNALHRRPLHERCLQP